MDKKKILNTLKVGCIDLLVWIWAFVLLILSRHIDNFILQWLVISICIFPGNWYIMEYLKNKYKV